MFLLISVVILAYVHSVYLSSEYIFASVPLITLKANDSLGSGFRSSSFSCKDNISLTTTRDHSIKIASHNASLHNPVGFLYFMKKYHKDMLFKVFDFQYYKAKLSSRAGDPEYKNLFVKQISEDFKVNKAYLVFTLVYFSDGDECPS